jgi:tRNA/rRNA methyltransferase
MTAHGDHAASLLLDRLAVVLYRPKYAENVGSVARACLNMGCGRIILVDPQSYDQDRALPLATVHGAHLLEQASHQPDLSRALAPFTQVYGATARMGGWRKTLLSPAQAAVRIIEQLLDGHNVALLFGPEDRGLTNAQIKDCGQLVTIPAAKAGVSLNLAQAVIILLYECLQAARGQKSLRIKEPQAQHVTHAEQEALFDQLKQTLTAIDFIQKDNPEYWMLRLRRFWHRMGLQRHEYTVLMGICRQMDWALRQRRRRSEDG